MVHKDELKYIEIGENFCQGSEIKLSVTDRTVLLYVQCRYITKEMRWKLDSSCQRSGDNTTILLEDGCSLYNKKH